VDDREQKDPSVSMPVIQFVDREIEKERLLTASERERLREIVFEKFRGTDEATKLAYHELQRRLDVLNHAHENMVKDRELFQSRESFEQFFQDFGKWRDSVNAQLSNQAGRTATWVTVVGIAFLLLQVLLRFWKP
jgi:hypothetical protein